MKTRWRTLVVGENAAGEALAAKLRADGHHVDIARSGREALDRGREQRYVAYLIEFEVAGRDGVEIMKEIRRAERKPPSLYFVPGPALTKTSSYPWLKEQPPGRRAIFHP